MTEPVAWRAKDVDDDEYQIYDYKPLYFDIIEPLYALEQLNLPRIKMTQEEFDEWKEIFNDFEFFSDAMSQSVTPIEHTKLFNKIYVQKHDYFSSYEVESRFAKLWSDFDPDKPEETIGILPDMKWFVRSKEKNGDRYLYLKKPDDFVTPWYTVFKDLARYFDTKEEAELWNNPQTEAVHLIIEEE